MSDHTPGPWTVSRFGGCTVYGPESPKQKLAITSGSDPMTNRANARLISSAPDMLAALQAWAKFYDMSGDYPEAESLHAEMLAAIAKATGQEPQ